MSNDENLNDSRASANGDPAGSSKICMNESGSEKSGTYLTQACSGFDLENTSRRLIALRLKLGARSPAGHRCSNLIEQLKNYERTTDEWQQANLAKGIKEQMHQLAELTAGH
jgi:hypothetical protein